MLHGETILLHFHVVHNFILSFTYSYDDKDDDEFLMRATSDSHGNAKFDCYTTLFSPQLP